MPTRGDPDLALGLKGDQQLSLDIQGDPDPALGLLQVNPDPLLVY